MDAQIQKRLAVVLLFVLNCFLMPAQTSGEQKDSLVRLVKGSSLQLVTEYGHPIRKASDATFFHNNTYLICDTARWDVDRNVIDAMGNVQLIQDQTILTSDRLEYDINLNLAMFRGSVVQLQDKQKNTLRTCCLDYNTKDSVAVFSQGGSMKDKDGKIMESLDGRYESCLKLFTFTNEVNMFADSVFIKTSKLEYESDKNLTHFREPVDFWKDGNMLSAKSGNYDKKIARFFFEKNVHAMSQVQEAWSDTLYFYNELNNILLLGNAQVQDTTRGTIALANHIFYEDSTAILTMKRDAALALRTVEGERVDTLYCGADVLVYRTVPKYKVDEEQIKAAADRLGEFAVDPVNEYRRKAALEAAKKAEEAAKNDPNNAQEAARRRDTQKEGKPDAEKESKKKSADVKENVAADTPAATDSLAVQADSIQVKDSTKVGFIQAVGNVQVFRKDIQMHCDSLKYCDLDSVARLYIDPVIWNDGNRQYSADSVFLLVRKGGLDKASLMSNAFVITQEDTLSYDQIKSTELMAYFGNGSALKRFDALGDATAMFFIEEKECLSTINKVESKMMSATFEDGKLDRVYYFDSPKNDAYPTVQVPKDERKMKGFNWDISKRPNSPSDITSIAVRPSERSVYSLITQPPFVQTDRFFPGYIERVRAEIADRARRKELEKHRRDSIAALGPMVVVADSLKTAVDSLVAPGDSLGVLADSLRTGVDSLRMGADSLKNEVDSLKVVADSLNVAADSLKMTPAQIKKQEREAAQKAKQEAREAKWREADRKAAEKEAEKKARKDAARKERLQKEIEDQRRIQQDEAERLEKYLQKYEKKMSR